MRLVAVGSNPVGARSRIPRNGPARGRL